jgi:hypothetical protein
VADTPADSEWIAPPPVLFNAWKHHAGFLRRQIAGAVQRGGPGLEELARGLVVVGTDLMDLYVGALSPHAIGAAVLAQLRAECRLDLDAYRTWLAGQSGYAVLALPDGSRWVVRLGDEGDRYVHVHPGRGSPATRRVRANVHKTAVLALAWAGVHGGDPTERALVNQVRREYLGLSPVGKELWEAQGLGAVIALLGGGSAA